MEPSMSDEGTPAEQNYFAVREKLQEAQARTADFRRRAEIAEAQAEAWKEALALAGDAVKAEDTHG